MRLLNRLHQYQRLWQPSAGEPQQVTVGELAERCFCSERHIRTLLRQAQESGWLSWQASSGRQCSSAGLPKRLIILDYPAVTKNTLIPAPTYSPG